MSVLIQSASARDRSRTPVPFAALRARGQQLSGIVKSFNGTWGFVQSPEIAGDIFFHSRESPQLTTGPALQPGEAVEFQVAQGSESQKNNGLSASNVQRQVFVGMQRSVDEQEGEWVTGTLTKHCGSMAFCSVEGIDTDVLLGERCWNASGVNPMALQVGACLTLKVASGPKGYHATQINPPTQNWEAGQQGQRVRGKLTKTHGGNGFCSVAGVEGDVLLGYRSLTEAGLNLEMMQVGDNLTFELVMGPKGYHATNIQPLWNQQGMAMGPKGYQAFNIQQAVSGLWNHVGMAMGPKGYHVNNIQQAVSGLWNQGGKQVVGTLKRIHDGNGFCSVTGVEGDVLLGSRSLTEAGVNLETMQVGDNLTFQLAMGPKGYHATNIQKSRAGNRVVGTLKRIHGGNGFCSVAGVENDVLLGYRSLTESGLNLETMQVGDNVTFDMAMGPKGYHATNIQKGADNQLNHVDGRTTGRLKVIQGSMGFCSVEGISGDVLLGDRSLKESGIDLGTMQVGDALSFDMACGSKGYYASNIQIEPQVGW